MFANRGGSLLPETGNIPAEALEQVAQLRPHFIELFGKMVLTLMGLPRYCHLPHPPKTRRLDQRPGIVALVLPET